MFSLNRIDIIGYQTQPVTLRQTPSGTSVTDLNLVVPYSFQSAKGEALSGKSFFTVTVWGAMADIAGQYVRAGSQLFISGRLQTDSWEDEQTHEKRNKTKVVALDMIILDPKAGQLKVSASPSITSCMNRVQVVGNVTRDPELRTTTTGNHVLTLGVATNEKWKDKASGETKERTEFHNVVVWGDLAKDVQQAVKKGQRMFVSGRLQTRSFDGQDGKKRYTTEIVADQLSMLGIQNAEALASMQSDSVLAASRASQPASQQVSESSLSTEALATVESMPVAAGGMDIPPVNYESEIKPEDLPF